MQDGCFFWDLQVIINSMSHIVLESQMWRLLTNSKNEDEEAVQTNDNWKFVI
jgi:hypothetical protein